MQLTRYDVSCDVRLLQTGFAQQIGNPTTQQGVIPPRGTFVIRNARIVTVSGADIENGSIVIRDGKIEAVGATCQRSRGRANRSKDVVFRSIRE